MAPTMRCGGTSSEATLRGAAQYSGDSAPSSPPSRLSKHGNLHTYSPISPALPVGEGDLAGVVHWAGCVFVVS
eukprot:5194949-Pleurochrysis_carterae.AAC.1